MPDLLASAAYWPKQRSKGELVTAPPNPACMSGGGRELAARPYPIATDVSGNCGPEAGLTGRGTMSRRPGTPLRPFPLEGRVAKGKLSYGFGSLAAPRWLQQIWTPLKPLYHRRLDDDYRDGSPWTVTLVRQLPWVSSTCWTVPTENARLAIMTPLAAAAARHAIHPLITGYRAPSSARPGRQRDRPRSQDAEPEDLASYISVSVTP